MLLEHKEMLCRSRADIAWKEAIENFFPETLAFAFPGLYSIIDWKLKWDFLDKELQVIAPNSEENPRFIDKLVRVSLLNGDEKWLLVHVEIQGNKDKDFSQRMFVYHYRIYDKFRRHPVSCAILTDTAKEWRPMIYEHNQAGCELFFKFQMLKLLDLESQRAELEKSNNPFASIALIQLNTLKLKTKPYDQRLHLKLSETKKLYEKGFSKDIIRKLFYFIDCLVSLPAGLDIQYGKDMAQFEEAKNMAYVSSIERNGIKKGLELGIQQGLEKGIDQTKKETALRLFRLGQSIDLISAATELSKEELSVLFKQQNS